MCQIKQWTILTDKDGLQEPETLKRRSRIPWVFMRIKELNCLEFRELPPQIAEIPPEKDEEKPMDAPSSTDSDLHIHPDEIIEVPETPKEQENICCCKFCKDFIFIAHISLFI